MRHASTPADKLCALAPKMESLEERRLLAFSALIDFQPPNAPTQSSYKADTGAVFGARSGGLSYGWNATNSTGIDRNSKKYQAYDTLPNQGLYRRGDFGGERADRQHYDSLNQQNRARKPGISRMILLFLRSL